MSKARGRYLLTLILCLSLIPLISARGEGTRLMGLRCRSSDGGSRITLDLSGETRYEITPARGKILITLKGCESGIVPPPNRLEDKLIRSISIKPVGGDLMVTIELKRRANLSAFMTRSPYKLIVDLYPLPKPKPNPDPKPQLSLTPPKTAVKSPLRRPPKKPLPPQLKPEGKPEPKPLTPVTSPPVEDKDDTGFPSTDLASILNNVEGKGEDDVEMPKVGITVSPFLMAQLLFNLVLLAALYLLWRKVSRLTSGVMDRGNLSGARDFSAVLEEVVDLETSQLTKGGDDPKVQKVKEMLKEGFSVDEIAKKTGIPKGEVELITSLSEI